MIQPGDRQCRSSAASYVDERQRYDSTLGQFEGYTSAWGGLGGGATGGGADQVFVENSDDVTVDYTITSGKNAMSVGPITVASGVAVTIPSGSRWVIL